jgi:hypothetical protein
MQDDVPDHLQYVLKWIVTKIRNTPAATYAQAETAWNNEMAEELFDFDKLITYLQNLVGESVTWDQFKSYLINKNFDGIDD